MKETPKEHKDKMNRQKWEEKKYMCGFINTAGQNQRDTVQNDTILKQKM